MARLREVDIWVDHGRGDHALSLEAEGTFRAITLAAGVWLSAHEVTESRSGLRIVLQDAPRADFVFKPLRDHDAYPVGPGDWLSLYAIGAGFRALSDEDRWHRAAALVVEVVDTYGRLTPHQRSSLSAHIGPPRPSATWIGDVTTKRGWTTCLRGDVDADGSLSMHLLAVNRADRQVIIRLPCDPTTLRYQPSDLQRYAKSITRLAGGVLRIMVPMRDERNLGYDTPVFLNATEPPTSDGQEAAGTYAHR